VIVHARARNGHDACMALAVIATTGNLEACILADLHCSHQPSITGICMSIRRCRNFSPNLVQRNLALSAISMTKPHSAAVRLPIVGSSHCRPPAAHGRLDGDKLLEGLARHIAGDARATGDSSRTCISALNNVEELTGLINTPRCPLLQRPY